MRDLEDIPTDGTHFLVKTRIHVFDGYGNPPKAIGFMITEATYRGGHIVPWVGPAISTTASLDPVGWFPMPEGEERRFTNIPRAKA